MNADFAVAVLREAARRREAARAQRDTLVGSSFAAQSGMLTSTARLKAALCTRRAGKSFGCGIGLFDAALSHPGVSCVYIGLTRETAARVMEKDVLDRLNEEHGLRAKKNATKLSWTLPNGSVIYLIGADASEREMAKVLGQKFKRVIVDEAQSYRIDLRTMVFKHLRPATADMLGDIWLTGTPDDVQAGLFFEVTSGEETFRDVASAWELHGWSAADNPHMAKQWAAELADIAATRPLFFETPEFQQHYLGKWAINATALCYRYSSSRNDCALPTAPFTSGVLGVDLGFEDATAFVAAGYREHERALHFVEAQKHSGLIISQVAEHIRAYLATYPWIHKVVVDGANKQAVEEMRQRHGLQLEAAEKTDKFAHIHMMNSDLIQALVRVNAPGCAPLLEEWSRLVWAKDRSGDKLLPEEDPKCPNHCADAGLYAWRYAKSYYAQPAAPPRPHPNSEAALEEQLAREEAEMRREQGRAFWEYE